MLNGPGRLRAIPAFSMETSRFPASIHSLQRQQRRQTRPNTERVAAGPLCPLLFLFPFLTALYFFFIFYFEAKKLQNQSYQIILFSCSFFCFFEICFLVLGEREMGKKQKDYSIYFIQISFYHLTYLTEFSVPF